LQESRGEPPGAKSELGVLLRPAQEIESLLKESPEALSNTLKIAERCDVDLISGLDYRFPNYPAPEGHTAESFLEKLCYEAAVRRYGSVTDRVRQSWRKSLTSSASITWPVPFDVQRGDQAGEGGDDRAGVERPFALIGGGPAGAGRGSSVASLVGYLIGLSHIDPLQYNLTLERFLPADAMTNVLISTSIFPAVSVRS